MSLDWPSQLMLLGLARTQDLRKKHYAGIIYNICTVNHIVILRDSVFNVF